jgi:hypothetical protein
VVCQTTVVLDCMSDLFKQNLVQKLPHLFGKDSDHIDEEVPSPIHHREFFCSANCKSCIVVKVLMVVYFQAQSDINVQWYKWVRITMWTLWNSRPHMST